MIDNDNKEPEKVVVANPGTKLKQGAKNDQLGDSTEYPAEMLLVATERLFGYPRWVIDGALAFANLQNEEHLTKERIQDALDGFLKQQDQGHVKALQAQEEK